MILNEGNGKFEKKVVLGTLQLKCEDNRSIKSTNRGKYGLNSNKKNIITTTLDNINIGHCWTTQNVIILQQKYMSIRNTLNL